MASRYEVEVTLTSAKDLKNVNWRHGRLKPYAVVWVDPNNKCSTRVEEEGDTSPYWDQTLVIPLKDPIQDSTLYIDIVHANAAEDTKPLIGSARLHLRDVVDDAGVGQRVTRKLDLKRPSGRPHGKLELEVSVREPRYRAPDPYYAPPYGVPPASRDYPAPSPYGNPYAAPPSGYPYATPSYGSAQMVYGQPSYGQPAPAPAPYGNQSYGQPSPPPPPYGNQSYGYGHQKEEKKSKFGGMGTGLAVGAVAGALGGLALAEGFDHLEDKIADDAAERVQDDLADGDFDGDDF